MFIPKNESEVFFDTSEYDELINIGVDIFNQNAGYFVRCIRTLDLFIALTSKGNIYTTVIHYDRVREDNPILLEMKENNDTEIVRYIAIHAMGGYDFAPFDFIQKLIELNPKNLEAEMLLTAECGFVKRKLKDIMPESFS